MSHSISSGDHIPSFSLPDQNGELFNSKRLKGKKHVIYFYPKDDTPGCTREACGFRDAFEDFKAAGAEVIGISSDSGKSHKQFAAKHNLPFILLSDEHKEVQKKFGVQEKLFGLIPGRVTFIADSNGVVRHVFRSLMNAEKHIEEAKRVVAEID